MLPISSVEATFPATRTTNRSPMPWSNRTSGGTRESEQVSTVAKGCCPFWPVSDRRAASWRGCTEAPATKRVLPSRSFVKASSGVSPGPAEEAMATVQAASIHTATAVAAKIRFIGPLHESAWE